MAQRKQAMMKSTQYLLLITVLVTGPVLSGDNVWDKGKETYSGPKNITVYRDPGCGCCTKWIKHLKKHGFAVTDVKTKKMADMKKKFKVPPHLASCHTGVINGYVVEGHVPADDIKKLLKTKPKVTGLSVPAMPVGTPGMEVPGRKDPFSVLSFRPGGKSQTFRRYVFY